MHFTRTAFCTNSFEGFSTELALSPPRCLDLTGPGLKLAIIWASALQYLSCPMQPKSLLHLELLWEQAVYFGILKHAGRTREDNENDGGDDNDSESRRNGSKQQPNNIEGNGQRAHTF